MSYRIEFAVLSEQKPDCRFGLTLHNLSDQDLQDWSLHFVIDRYIQPTSVTNGQLTQIGSLCSIVPTEKVLAANSHFYCEFIIKTAPYHFYTDGVKHAFVQLNDQQPVERIDVAVNPIVLASPFRERSQIPHVEAAELCVIPKPNSLQRFNGEFVVSSSSQISLQSDLAARAAHWLDKELYNLHGFTLNAVGHSDIVYRNNPMLDEGRYHLNIDAQGIKIEAGSHSGFMHASATLLQLAQAQHGRLSFPLVKIADAPRFKYRGMMLDCARHFHSLEQVKRVINQLAHYKFNVFTGTSRMMKAGVLRSNAYHNSLKSGHGVGWMKH